MHAGAPLLQIGGKSMSEGARDLGIGTTNLHRWRQQFLQREDYISLEDHARAIQEEVQRLKIEIEVRKQERGALKKAVTIFSRVR